MKDLEYKNIDENCIIPIKFSMGRTLSMDNYESCRFEISLKVYCALNKVDETYHLIRTWVLQNIQSIAKEVMQNIEKYAEKKKKKSF
jgi:hypothetical protein